MTTKRARAAGLVAFAMLSLAAASAEAKRKADTLPPPALVDLNQIDAALDAQRYVQAKSMIEQAKLAQQSSPRLDLQLAEYWLATGNIAQARAAFEQLTSAPELKARAYQGAGIAAFRLNDAEAALTSLKAAVEADPSLFRAWNALGAAADRKGNWALAETAYGKALALKPKAADVLSNRGYSYLLQKRYGDAIRDLSAAVAVGPSSEATRNNLRLALALNGQYVEAFAGADARDIYKQLNNIGYAAMLRGDYQTAEAYFTRALEASDIYYRRAAQNLSYLESLTGSHKDGQQPK